MPVGNSPLLILGGFGVPTGALIESDMEPISKEERERMSSYARKVIESKGYQFYRYVYEQGIRDAEKFHGISVPTHTTRESRSKKNETLMDDIKDFLLEEK